MNSGRSTGRVSVGGGAVADADGVGWQVGCVALALEVSCGPALGLRVGVDDAPTATAPLVDAL